MTAPSPSSPMPLMRQAATRCTTLCAFHHKGLTSSTAPPLACATEGDRITIECAFCKSHLRAMWSLHGGRGTKMSFNGFCTWTALQLMGRQPLTLRLVKLCRVAATTVREASVRRRQQCRPSTLSCLQLSATAINPMSRICMPHAQTQLHAEATRTRDLCDSLRRGGAFMLHLNAKQLALLHGCKLKQSRDISTCWAHLQCFSSVCPLQSTCMLAKAVHLVAAAEVQHPQVRAASRESLQANLGHALTPAQIQLPQVPAPSAKNLSAIPLGTVHPLPQRN